MFIRLRELTSARCQSIAHITIYEPQHDKTNKMICAPSEDSAVWSESSLCAQWVAKGPMFLQADSEDPDLTGRMPRLICVFTVGAHAISLVLSWGGSYVSLYTTCHSRSNVVRNALGTSLFPNPWMDRIHIWSDDRYGSKVFLSAIPTHTHGLKVKVTDLEVIVVKIVFPNRSVWSTVTYFPELSQTN